MSHKATKVTVIAEKLLQDGVTRLLEQAGATGYSVFEGGGKGRHGPKPADAPHVVGPFAIVKIEAVLAERAAAEAAAEAVARAYFDNYSGIVYLEEVEVLRRERF